MKEVIGQKMLVFPTLLPSKPKKHRTAKVFSAFAVRCFLRA
ncbi:hypothetical protein RV08_GL002470 [Enterococcus mundtii]|nr:hypothetical protein RV08_GL002470 [Enterococcus mundtii]